MKILLVFASHTTRDWWLRCGPYSPSERTHAVLNLREATLTFGNPPATVIETAVVTGAMDMRELQKGRFYDLVMSHPSFDPVLRSTDSLRFGWDSFVQACLLER